MLARRLTLAVVLAAWSLAPDARAAESGGAFRKLPDILERVRLCVGCVGTYNPADKPSRLYSGTGFFIDKGGYFITANHVVAKITEKRRAADLRVFIPADSKPNGRPATIVAREPKYDLVLLKAEGSIFNAMELGDSTKSRAGEPIAVCGFPLPEMLGLHPSVNTGFISSVCPISIPAINTRLLSPEIIEALKNPFDVFQLDANSYPGNSGSPVFDPLTGQAIGVLNSAFIKTTKERIQSTGISYAMPIHLAKKLVDIAKQAEAAKPKDKKDGSKEKK